MAIANKYPSLRPTLLLDFANSQTVDSRITFTRASTARRTNARGLIETVAANVPRIDFDPVTGECKGLLIEEQRTNLLTYSEQFDNAAWIKGNMVVTPNTAVAPDGTITADTSISTSAGGSIYQNVTGISGTGTYTLYSYFHTSSTETVCGFIAYFLGAETQPFGINFNASTATFIGQLGSGTSHSISTPVNGWYRVSITFTGTNVANTTLRVQMYQNSSLATLVRWGAQLEAGAFPTSYIKTEASQVTRAADLPFMIGTSFSDWYRQDEGTFVVSATSPRAASEALIAANDNTNNNAINVYATPVNVQTQVKSANVEQALFAFTPTGQTLVALAYKANDFAASVNGSAVQTDVSATVPAVTQLRIGGLGAGGVALNGHIRRIAYYPKRLTNEQLQALSA